MEDIALLKSPGREKILVEGAKKEGKVTFYTGLIVPGGAAAQGGIRERLSVYPGGFFSRQLGTGRAKMLAEYQAKRFDVDLISGSGATTMVKQAGFMQRFYSPHLAEYSTSSKTPKAFGGALTFIS